MTAAEQAWLQRREQCSRLIEDSWNPRACVLVLSDLTELAPGLLLSLHHRGSSTSLPLVFIFHLGLPFTVQVSSGVYWQAVCSLIGFEVGIHTDASVWIRCLQPRRRKPSDLSKNGFWGEVKERERRWLVLAKQRLLQEAARASMSQRRSTGRKASERG